MAQATGSQAVSSGSVVTSITHNLSNSGFITAVAPSWNTTVWVASRNTNAATLYFGTQVGSGGGRVDWRVET